MKKVGGKVLLGFIAALVILTIYTFWDNNRITIDEKEIRIDNLPVQMENFIILQISDLHEKKFGENQEKLINAINDINYDAIVFTGDMLDGIESKNYKPFYTLLDGITNKKHALFVPGNADPESYQVKEKVEKSTFVKGIEKRGVTLLETVDTVRVDDAEIHFVNFELSVMKSEGGINNGIPEPSYASNKEFLAYQQDMIKKMKDMKEMNGSDVLVAINHYPAADKRIDYISQNNNAFLEYDLLIAGHYHGGQIRLPLAGAFFVPEAWYENGGFFPPKNRVKGLWEYKGVQQYVSTGLGSSDAISILKFRLFNPPQINVLTLTRGN